MSKFLRAFLALLLLLSIAPAQAPRPRGVNPEIGPSVRAIVAAAGEILSEVSRLRELKIVRPVRSGVKTRADLERTVIKNFDESATPEELDQVRKTLIAFGLISPDFPYRQFMIELLTEQIAGFYEPKTREFYVTERESLEELKPIIAHELTHALQDQHFNLRRFEKWPRGDSDRELAIHALIEGDATVLMFNYLLKPRGLDVAKLPGSLTAMTEMLAANPGSESDKLMAKAPAAIRETLLFPYLWGAGFAQELLRREGWRGISRAYAELPQSTEQIIHVEKYLAREAPVKITLPDLASLLGPGWKRIDADVTGEFGYQVILGEYLAKREARAASAGWGGDQSAVYEDSASQALLLAHLSAWDSPLEADEFFRAYERRLFKRYPEAKAEEGGSAERRVYRTRDGYTGLELRGQRVAIIEGLPGRQRGDLAKLSSSIWK